MEGFWHLASLASPANDNTERASAERLPSEWRRRRADAAAIAWQALRERGVTVEACALAWDDATSVAWGRLHGQRPLGAEQIFSLDRDDAVAVFEAWARGKRAA